MWLLLHGALGVGKDLEQFKSFLENRGEKVFMPDISGHGSNIKQLDFKMSIPNLSNWLLQEIKDKAIENVFGYSMGGYIALYLQAKGLYNFENIYTYGTKLDWNADFLKSQRGFLNKEFMLEKIPAFTKFLENAHGENWDDLLNNTLNLMEDLVSNSKLVDSEFKNISSSISMLRGSKDIMVSSQECEEFAKLNPRIKVIEVADSSHEIQKVDPSVITELFV